MSNLSHNRAKSAHQKQPSRQNQKPRLQTKYKDRVNNTQLIQRPSTAKQSNNNQRQKQLQDSFYEEYKQKGSQQRPASVQSKTDSDFRKTSTKLCNLNFKNHDPNLCVCEDCTCGRHLCKFHNIGPDLKKSTTYKMSYPKKIATPNQLVIAQQYPKFDGPHLDMNSTQRSFYQGRKGDDLQRPHPQDLLKTGGPCNKLTSYSSGFPGYKGQNQYIKPTDKHYRGHIPFTGTTTNQRFHKSLNGKPANLEKTNDSFRLGQPWYGQTSYANSFMTPKDKDYDKINYKSVEKRLINPQDKNQFQTTHRNQYPKHGSGVCAAKTKLQTILRGQMKSKKGNFSQNTDFKAMSPQFQAFSTSKQIFI